jgi:hypothetical protein
LIAVIALVPDHFPHPLAVRRQRLDLLRGFDQGLDALVLQLIRQHALWVLRRMHVDVGAGSALTIAGRSATTCMLR